MWGALLLSTSTILSLGMGMTSPSDKSERLMVIFLFLKSLMSFIFLSFSLGIITSLFWLGLTISSSDWSSTSLFWFDSSCYPEDPMTIFIFGFPLLSNSSSIIFFGTSTF